MERSFVVTAYRPEVGPQQLPDLGSMGHVWGQLKTRVGWHSAASQESLWGFTGRAVVACISGVVLTGGVIANVVRGNCRNMRFMIIEWKS